MIVSHLKMNNIDHIFQNGDAFTIEELFNGNDSYVSCITKKPVNNLNQNINNNDIP